MVAALWDKYETYCINKGLTKLRIKKLKVMFNSVARNNVKPLDKLTKKDIQDYVDKLNRGEFKKKDGEPYSPTTISDIKKFLKQFYKWLRGEGEYHPDDVNWISVKIPKDQKPTPKDTLNIDECIKLANTFTKTDYKIITLLLFDSGFRIDEMLSVKKRDLNWNKFDEAGNKCFWISCNESKTFNRNIPVPLFTNDIEAYFKYNEKFLEKNSNDKLLDVHYESYLKLLKKNSLRLFKRKITSHCLRHSSATHYAIKLDGDIIALCDRYGWAYGSKQPQIYVRRTGANNIKTAKKMFYNDVTDLKEENRLLKESISENNRLVVDLALQLEILKRHIKDKKQEDL